MANCAGITKGAAVSCDDPLVVGIEQRVLLANRKDVESITYDGSDNHLITGITMKTGKAFFEFAGINQTIQARYELVRNPTSNTFKHFIDLSVFEVDSTQLANTEAMAYVDQIAIIIQREETSLGNAAINVFGVNAGLQLLTDVRNWGDVDTGAAMVLNLGTPDEGYIETRKPDPFFNGDYATSLAAVEALLTPAS
jgi:hypothetical protein